MNISENELLEVLRQFSQVNNTEDGAALFSEIKDAWKVSSDKARELIHYAVKAGKMEAVRVRRPRIDGVYHVTTAYRLKQ